MADRWLREITDIAGVEGVLLSSHSGQVVYKIGTAFDAEKQEYIARHVARMFAVSKLAKEELKEVELIWQDYQALAMNAGGFVLIIFCGSTRALSLIRITINVVIAHLLEDKKFMKQINKLSATDPKNLSEGSLDQMEINLISKLQ